MKHRKAVGYTVSFGHEKLKHRARLCWDASVGIGEVLGYGETARSEVVVFRTRAHAILAGEWFLWTNALERIYAPRILRVVKKVQP